MSKHRFTPGPWIVRQGDEWTCDVVTHHGVLPDGSPNAWTVASCNRHREECSDNLRLIAAAPELLAALTQLCFMAHANKDSSPELKAACVGAAKVIANATGSNHG